jgi:DeoR/GlpR family transcriptional regulator of sugar metabolism
MAFCHSVKRRIAKAAAQIVEEDETIMLESGSCCALFAEELAKRAKKVFILTESTKFQRHGAYNMFQLDKIAGVFTDDGIPEEA